MLNVLSIFETVYGTQDPLKLIHDELSAIQDSVTNSFIAHGVKIDKVLTESDEIFTQPDGSQFDLRDWYNVKHKPFFIL